MCRSSRRRRRRSSTPTASPSPPLRPHEFERAFAPKRPATLGGAAFLAHPGGHGDGATEVAADRTYPVLAPAAHAVHEGHRARLARELLSGGAARGGAAREALGELMLQSHASYARCGLGAPATDRLVALAEELGLAGAKVTGGGRGGTVCVLGSGSAADADRFAALVARFAEETGHSPAVFTGSSPGAAAFGHLRVRLRGRRRRRRPPRVLDDHLTM